MAMQLTTPAFKHQADIPQIYTCDVGDKETSPPLQIRGVPPNTQSLALIMDDPDSPSGTWDHWIVYNIPSNTTEITEGQALIGTPALNSWGKAEYGGPCPGNGKHRYVFKLYALDIMLTLTAPVTKIEVEAAMKGHILEQTELIGTYERQA